MEASSVRRKVGGNWPGGAFSGRRGPLAIAIGAALVAGVILYIFVQQYKKNVNGTVNNTPVFIATHYIQRGTAANQLAANTLFQRTLVKNSQVVTGAITDPRTLQGEVAAANIYPGQQLTLGDFTRSGVTIASQFSGTERAMAVPVDGIHGLSPFVQAGDYVDVLESISGGGSTGLPLVTTVAQGVLVLAVSGGGGGGIGGGGAAGEIVLRVDDKLALPLAAAADGGKIWITLRPAIGAKDSVRAIGKVQ
jgi:Flp pilus assembly protein CpaB